MIKYEGPERRTKPRICEGFPAKVSGTDTWGHPFNTDVLLENLSASGLYLTSSKKVKQGSRLSVVICLSSVEGRQDPGACVATRGIVVRVDSKHRANYGLAVEFTSHSFL